MPKSSRYAPSPEPQRRRQPPRQEDRTFWQTRSSKPPREPVGPALQALRRRWYAQNPWRPDWQAHWEALRGARACFLERGTA